MAAACAMFKDRNEIARTARGSVDDDARTRLRGEYFVLGWVVRGITANACFVKVVHNGKIIHENVELKGPTRAATYQDERPRGPIMLQGDHGPVAYRNLRIRTVGDAQ